MFRCTCHFNLPLNKLNFLGPITINMLNLNQSVKSCTIRVTCFNLFWPFKRRQWLQEALASITEDTYVKRMMKDLQTLEKPENGNDDDDDELNKKEDAFEELAEIVDNLDNANGRCTFSI